MNIPDKPENAMKTSVEVTVDNPMTDSNYISKIHILCPKNTISFAVTATLTPKSGMAFFATEIRVGMMQEVVVLAETNDGKIFKSAKMVQVEASGCGG